MVDARPLTLLLMALPVVKVLDLYGSHGAVLRRLGRTSWYHGNQRECRCSIGGALGDVEHIDIEQRWLLERKGSWWEVSETDLILPLLCYVNINLQKLFSTTCFHPRCLSLVLLSTTMVALQPSRHPMAQRSSVCCAARWQNARHWEKMWPWSNATEQAMAAVFHTLQFGWLDDCKISCSLLAPIFWWWNWYPDFFGSIARQIEVAMEKHCQAQPWEILLRWVLNVLFMAKAL